MKQYALERLWELLERLAKELSRTSDSPDPEAVHDLRVTIRRLNGCLRAFGQFYPGRERKRARRRLSTLMDLAAAVRDRDIALVLIEAAGVPAAAPVMVRLRRQRDRAGRKLSAEAGRWTKRGFARRWRKELAV